MSSPHATMPSTVEAPAAAPEQRPRWARARPALGAAALLLFGFWLGARLGPLTALGSSDPVGTGTWLPTPTPAEAYVGGAVRHPGLYPLAANARVVTLLRAAGGPTRYADLAHVSLGAPVHDGDTISVPLRPRCAR